MSGQPLETSLSPSLDEPSRTLGEPLAPWPLAPGPWRIMLSAYMGVNLVCVGDSVGVAAVWEHGGRTVATHGDKRAFTPRGRRVRGHPITPSRYFVLVLSTLVHGILDTAYPRRRAISSEICIK